MKSRAVVHAHDPADLARRVLLALLWLGTFALAVAALIGMVPSFSLAAVPSGAAAERFTIAGDHVIVYDLAGAIEVLPGSGPDVVVDVMRGGRAGGTLKVATGAIEGRPTLRVLFPMNRILYPAGRSNTNGIAVRPDGTFGGKIPGLFPRRVSVSSRGFGDEAWADLRILVPAGRTLEVRVGVGAMNARGVEGTLTLDSHAGPVLVDGLRGDLSVDTGSGAVAVKGIEGDLLVDTGSGSVTLDAVHGRKVSIDTGSGEVSGRDVRAENLLVDTGSGRVAIEQVRAPRVKIDTGSGGVTLGLLEDVDDVLVDTGSGGVTLRVPGTLGAALDIDTGSGGIESEVPITMLRRESGELHGQLGDGRGHILIDTGSGGVRLVKI